MVVTVFVKNWTKYNPRADVKSCSWYRQDNGFFSDPDFYGASPAVRLMWLYILCAVSKKMSSGEAKINLQMFCDSARISLEEAASAVTALVDMGSLEKAEGNEIPARSDSIASGKYLSATNERTNITNEHNERTNSPRAEPLPPRVEKGVTPDAIVQLYNEIVAPAVAGSPEKAHQFYARPLGAGCALRDFISSLEQLPRMDDWRELFSLTIQSPFLLGENPRKWRVNLPWLVSYDNAQKVLQGSWLETGEPGVGRAGAITPGNPTGNPYLDENGNLRGDA